MQFHCKSYSDGYFYRIEGKIIRFNFFSIHNNFGLVEYFKMIYYEH